jgi:polyhydroxyalkanoate synthesis regulator phasin
MNELAMKAKRQAERAYGSMKAINDDVMEGEFDGARSHIEILKRQLADLDEKLLAAALAPQEG